MDLNTFRTSIATELLNRTGGETPVCPLCGGKKWEVGEFNIDTGDKSLVSLRCSRCMFVCFISYEDYRVPDLTPPDPNTYSDSEGLKI